MKNSGYIIVGVLLLLLGGFIFNQSSSETPSSEDSQEVSSSADDVTTETSTSVESTLPSGMKGVYAYSDETCTTPTLVTPTVLDTRYEIPEINYITTLLRGYQPSGFIYPFDAETQLIQLRISQGVATLNMNSGLASDEGVCSPQANAELLTQTLLQFPSIDSVVLQVNGENF